jgi:hypothetical protein
MMWKGIVSSFVHTRNVKRPMNTPSEETSLYPFAPVYKNGIPYYRRRALIGWMNDQAALEARASLVEDIQDHHL